MYTDQTGLFTITSRKGNKYILVAYHYDSNTIHVKPLKTQTVIELKTSYHKLCILLTNRGLKPSLHILDNECINMLKTFMREVNEKFQLVPPHIHHINSAELYIWTFKEHLISGLRVQIKRHTCGLPPGIMMEPHSIWVGKSNYKKLLHFLSRLII